MSKQIKILTILLFCAILSSCSSSSMDESYDELSGAMYTDFGVVSTDSETLTVLIIDDLDEAFYQYVSLGEKNTDFWTVNFQQNISYAEDLWSEELTNSFTELVNSNSENINNFFNIQINCEQNNTLINIEEDILEGEIGNEFFLIELYIPFTTIYQKGFTKEINVVFVPVYNYIVCSNDGCVTLGGIEYNLEEFIDSHNRI